MYLFIFKHYKYKKHETFIAVKLSSVEGAEIVDDCMSRNVAKVEGLTIMLTVFINLLYTHTMPNNHYCSTYMMAYPHLMAKHCLEVGRKSTSEAETRQHVAVKVWLRDLQSC